MKLAIEDLPVCLHVVCSYKSYKVSPSRRGYVFGRLVQLKSDFICESLDVKFILRSIEYLKYYCAVLCAFNLHSIKFCNSFTLTVSLIVD
jgi:hypothetical protein